VGCCAGGGSVAAGGGTVEGITTIWALTALVGSITEVAVTKRFDKVSLGATVSKPFALIWVPCVTAPVPPTAEPTLHVTAELGLFVPVTDALNCWVRPAVNVTFEGLIVIDVTVGITTETETTPVLEVSKVEVAMTKSVDRVSFGATVSRPEAEILVPCVTTPVPEIFELTLYVTVLGGSKVPATAAMNC
jgi:hypothetical protein